MISLKFGSLPKMMVQDGIIPIPKGRMEVTDSTSDKQRAKGLVPMITKYE